jgi:hypothetical protein
MDAKDIQIAAETVWCELSDKYSISIAGVKIYSPESIRFIESAFELYYSRGIDMSFRSMPYNIRPFMFCLGAYIGEVVRNNVMEYNWNFAKVTEAEIELNLPEKVHEKFPNGKTLLPMNFIGFQIIRYQKGSILKWGADAGLTIGEFPKLPMA